MSTFLKKCVAHSIKILELCFLSRFKICQPSERKEKERKENQTFYFYFHTFYDILHGITVNKVAHAAKAFNDTQNAKNMKI